jgi:hypothetical protein
MRLLVKSSSSTVPTTRRIHSGTDLRYLRHPHQYHHLPAPSPTTSLYYPPVIQQQYRFVDPYRTMPSHSSGSLWQSTLPISHRYPNSYRQFNMDNRSLSQRLWDIDSGDDEDQIGEHIVHTRSHLAPTRERLNDLRSSHIENDDNMMLHIDDNEEEDEELYGQQYVQVHV